MKSKTRVTAKWFDREARAKLVAMAMERAERSANLLADAIRQNISTPGPEPSSPGEYPHKQTGELVESVRVVKRNQYRVDVVAEAPHAEYVEAMRPFVSRTLSEVQEAMEREAERP